MGQRDVFENEIDNYVPQEATGFPLNYHERI
jgi:hypothetical protein